MTARFVAAASVSLDGYLAGPGGDMSWLTPFIDEQPDQPDPILERLQAETTVLLCGATTFFGDDPNRGDPEKEGAFGGEWRGPVVVLTHRPPVAAGAVSTSKEGEVRFATTLDAAIELADRAAGEGVVNVLGASVGDQLLVAARLDEIIVSTVPVLLGGGTRFLDPHGKRPGLTQLETHVGGGAVTVRYRVERASR
ncbi:MAG: dihydrofolate reductase family protein [Patulibacter sp.]|nr:dihydrofolate reductase family protein [Patulibacter sp.]